MIHSPRQGVTDVLATFHSPRQGVTSVAGFHSPRQGVTSVAGFIHSPRQGATSVWDSEFGARTLALDSVDATDWVADCRHLWPVPQLSLQYAGLDLTDLLVDPTFTLPLNGRSTVSLSLRGPRDAYGFEVTPSPLALPGTGSYAGKIRQHDGSATRSAVFSCVVAGQQWTSEKYLPGEPTFDGSKLEWSFGDLTALAETELDDPLTDIIQAAGDLVTAHQAMRQWGNACGLTVDCRFPDYLLGEHRRGGMTPLQGMDALARQMQAGRRFENGTLVYEQVNPAGPPAWSFVDRLNIKQLPVTELPRAVNKLLVARFTPLGGKIGQASRTGGEALGLQAISFTPSRYVVIEEEHVEDGVLENWVFYSDAGTVLAGGGGGGLPVYSGPVPAVRAQFTYRPNIGRVFTPSYTIFARGGPIQRASTYRFERDDLAHQAAFGINKARRAMDDRELGNDAAANLAADAFLRESTRRVYSTKMVVPFLNPFIRPGHLVSIKDHLTAQLSTIWVVENVILRWRGRLSRMELECVRGL